jgi:hypothetical protein
MESTDDSIIALVYEVLWEATESFLNILIFIKNVIMMES